MFVKFSKWKHFLLNIHITLLIDFLLLLSVCGFLLCEYLMHSILVFQLKI